MGRNIDRLDIVATTISGSVKDWNKVSKLEPLFANSFPGRVRLHSVNSHQAAREATARALREGCRTIISAGGAGTFNSVVQGILDATDDLSDIRLGFLRKGSADLIGKVLNIPDVVEDAARVITEAMLADRFVECNVVNAKKSIEPGDERNFVGFGGIEMIGDIPFFTENPLTKYYKGLLSYLFGDLGPFRVGTTLALATWLLRKCSGKAHQFRLVADGAELAGHKYLAVLILNGDLGPDMPFFRGCALAKDEFYLVAIRDIGLTKIPGQLRRSFSGRILSDPEHCGLEMRTIKHELQVLPLMNPPASYRVNIDGLRWKSKSPITFKSSKKLRLLSG